MTEKTCKTWKEHKKITFFSPKDKFEFLTGQRDFFFVKNILQRGVLGSFLKITRRRVGGVCLDNGFILVRPHSDLSITMDTIAHEYLHKLIQCRPYEDGFFYDEHFATEKMGFGGWGL